MLNFNLPGLIFTLSVFISAAVPSAEAADCISGTGANTPARKHRNELEQDARKALGNSKAIVFFIVNEKDRETKKTFVVPLSKDDYRERVPAELLSATSPGQQIYAFHSTGTSAYIFPASEASMKSGGFKPSIECKEARKRNRFLPAPPDQGMGCQIVSLAGVKDATLIYDQAAKSCDDVVALNANEDRSEAEEADLLQSIKTLQEKFGSTSRVGPTRDLAIDKEATRVLPKGSTKQDIGSSQPPKKKTAKTGN